MQTFLIAIVIIIAMAMTVFIIRQPKKVQEWLLWAVTEAEKDLGAGTGKLKLRKVYDMFVEKYKIISFLVSFDTFSVWVNVALEEMEKMLKENKKIKEKIGA